MPPHRIDPFAAEGEWVRCALHAHTTRSDGELEPEALAAHYASAGFDVLAITDHWKRTDAASNGRLLVLPSVELNCILPAARDGHVLGFGISADADLASLGAEYADLERTAAFIVEHGGVAYLAHPHWTGATPGTLELPENVAGIEIWNAGCELEVGRGLSSVHWDELLETGRRCFGLVTDDSHHPGLDSGHGWTWLRVPERGAEAVLAALHGGSFYGSSGPMLHDVVLDGEDVEVRCSPARAVTLVAGRTEGAAVNAVRSGYRFGGEVLATDGEGYVTHARLTKPFAASFARIEVTDAAGCRAWTNPL